MTIRPAMPADLDELLALEALIESAPHWRRASYEAILANPRRLLLVAATNPPMDGADWSPALLGFAAASAAVPGGAAELETLAVAPSARRRGIARGLLGALIAWARGQECSSVLLEVRTQNLPAQALYASLGFVPAGRRANYYIDPTDDALVLSLAL